MIFNAGSSQPHLRDNARDGARAAVLLLLADGRPHALAPAAEHQSAEEPLHWRLAGRARGPALPLEPPPRAAVRGARSASHRSGAPHESSALHCPCDSRLYVSRLLFYSLKSTVYSTSAISIQNQELIQSTYFRFRAQTLAWRLVYSAAQRTTSATSTRLSLVAQHSAPARVITLVASTPPATLPTLLRLSRSSSFGTFAMPLSRHVFTNRFSCNYRTLFATFLSCLSGSRISAPAVDADARSILHTRVQASASV